MNGCAISGPNALLGSRFESTAAIPYVAKEIGAIKKCILVTRIGILDKSSIVKLDSK